MGAQFLPSSFIHLRKLFARLLVVTIVLVCREMIIMYDMRLNQILSSLCLRAVMISLALESEIMFSL